MKLFEAFADGDCVFCKRFLEVDGDSFLGASFT